MSRGERLVEYMDAKGFNARDLSRESGVAYTTIRSMIERDLANASIDNTIKICKALGIEVEDIIKEKTTETKVLENSERYQFQGDSSRHCYYPTSVSAGSLLSIDGINAEEIEVPSELMGRYAGSKDIFFLKVNGESMNKFIPHDSTIAVKKINIEELRDDDIVVFSNGHEYSVKRYYNDKNCKRHVFHSDSTERGFVDIIINYDESDELVIYGKVVMYIVTT